MASAALALSLASCGDWSPKASAPTSVPPPPTTTTAPPAATTTAPVVTSTIAAPTTGAVTTAPAVTTGPAVATTVPPATTVPGRDAPTGMVDVADLDPSILVSIDKVRSDNVTGRPLPGYEANRAFLLPEGARSLARVQRNLAARNLGLLVWDAYRPRRATQALVDWAYSIGRGDLVGPYIASVSYHNSGQAIDLTLVERSTRRELDMGTEYENFTPAAHTANATGVVAANRAILVEAMEAEGFENYSGEWWHFYYFVPGSPNLDEPVR